MLQGNFAPSKDSVGNRRPHTLDLPAAAAAVAAAVWLLCAKRAQRDESNFHWMEHFLSRRQFAFYPSDFHLPFPASGEASQDTSAQFPSWKTG